MMSVSPKNTQHTKDEEDVSKGREVFHSKLIKGIRLETQSGKVVYDLYFAKENGKKGEERTEAYAYLLYLVHSLRSLHEL